MMTTVIGFGQGPGDDHGPDDIPNDDYYADNSDSGDYVDAAEEAEIEELDLVEDDEPLPWLESDYDEEDEGVDTGRLIGFILLSLVALGLILAAAWYFLRDRPDPDLMPVGETIEAPEGDMKERPLDAGGKTFEGTGNVAPSVGQGETVEGTLSDGDSGNDEAPRPSIDAATGNTAQTNVGASGAGNSSDGVGVQVGAFSSRESAVAAWTTLRGQTTSLNGFRNRIVEGEVDGGKVYRLQAVAGDASAANTLCNALKGDGIACQVKR